MNSEQAKLLLPLLKDFYEHLCGMSCNDWELPNTPAGLALWKKINEWSDPEDSGEWTLDDTTGDTLFVPDFTAIGYLMHCMENYAVISGNEKREELAAYAHEAWAGWMRYMFRFCTDNADGTVTMDAEKVARWKRQMETDYADLPEDEKRSDRAEADQILAIINPPTPVELPF
jgi:hypothetical protein